MKKSLSITIACTIGAGIGTLIGMYWLHSLSFFEHFFAIIIGGAVAYLIYDIPQVWAGIKCLCGNNSYKK